MKLQIPSVLFVFDSSKFKVFQINKLLWLVLPKTKWKGSSRNAKVGWYMKKMIKVSLSIVAKKGWIESEVSIVKDTMNSKIHERN